MDDGSLRTWNKSVICIDEPILCISLTKRAVPSQSTFLVEGLAMFLWPHGGFSSIELDVIAVSVVWRFVNLAQVLHTDGDLILGRASPSLTAFAIDLIMRKDNPKWIIDWRSFIEAP